MKRFKDFQRLYNEERPHQALGNDTPAEHYERSPRCWDGVLREPDYGDHTVRRVRHSGEIAGAVTRSISARRWSVRRSAIEDEDGNWTSSTDPIALGFIAHDSDRLRKPKRKACGLVDTAERCPQGPQAQQPQQRPEQNEKCVTHVLGQNCYHLPGCSGRVGEAKPSLTRSWVRG